MCASINVAKGMTRGYHGVFVVPAKLSLRGVPTSHHLCLEKFRVKAIVEKEIFLSPCDDF